MTEIDNAYNNLASAIVLLTIKDYLKGSITSQQFERYIHSDWFRFLVDIEPEEIIKATYRMKRNSARKKIFFKHMKEFGDEV